MRQKTKTLVRAGLLTALALGISLLERLIILPVPGLRLGLANTVTLYLLLYHTKGEALAVLTARVTLSALIAGTVTSFIYSLTGGLCAFTVMLALRGLYPGRLSAGGLSVAGAAGHNLGQICAAALLLKEAAVFAYLPVLLCAAVVTGLLTGSLCALLYVRLQKNDLHRNR